MQENRSCTKALTNLLHMFIDQIILFKDCLLIAVKISDLIKIDSLSAIKLKKGELQRGDAPMSGLPALKQHYWLPLGSTVGCQHFEDIPVGHDTERLGTAHLET